MSRRREIVLAGVVGAGLAERLLQEQQDRLEERFSKSFLEQARVRARFVITEEMTDLMRAGTASGAPAPVLTGRGGIFAALWNLAESADAGLETAFDRIPIPQEFIEICNFLDADPYTQDDAGSALALAGDGEMLVRGLKEHGIFARVIGTLNESNARVCMRGEARCYLNRPERGGQ